MKAAGRLTLSGPIMAEDQIDKTSLYLAPFEGDTAWLLGSSGWQEVQFSSGPTDQVGPALVLGGSGAWAAGAIYDVVQALDSNGNPILGTLPAWTDNFTRSAALTRYNGIDVNAAQTTLRTDTSTTVTVDAYRARLRGTIRIGGAAGKLSAHFSFGQNRRHDVWNRDNQRKLMLKCGESYVSGGYHPYWGPNSWGPANNNTANNITILVGMPQDWLCVRLLQAARVTSLQNNGSYLLTAIGWNSTDTPFGTWGELNSENSANNPIAAGITEVGEYLIPPCQGANTAYALEKMLADQQPDGSYVYANAFTGEGNVALSTEWWG